MRKIIIVELLSPRCNTDKHRKMTQNALERILEQFDENSTIKIAMFDGTKIEPWNMGITIQEDDIVHIMTREGEFWVDVKAIAFIHYVI